MTEEQSKEPALHCVEHNQPAKYTCGVCGKPVCKECSPRGLNYQVYHPRCIDKARTKIEEHQHERDDLEAPSKGVKLFSWTFITLGILLFGMGLFVFIFSFVGNKMPIRALMTDPVAPSIDSLTGVRTAMAWIGAISLMFSIVIGTLGIGLLNCVAAARRVLLVFSWIELLVAILAWMVIGLIGQGFWEIPIIAIWAVAFFSRKRVKRQFEKVL